MQPYVVKQGDTVAKLAYALGFDGDTVWNHDENAQLRLTRPNPNILFPTDILYIPDQADNRAAMQSLTTGTTNTFVSTPPTVTVTLRFHDAPLVSQAYTVDELPQLTGLTTDGSGAATFAAPVTLDTATIHFTDVGAAFAIQIGHVDPIETLSGVVQRLQNLGYINPGATSSSTDMATLTAALTAFKATLQNGATPDADSTPSGTLQPAVSQASTSALVGRSGADDDGLPSTVQSNAGAIPAAPAEANAAPPDSGRADGQLDDVTSKLLLIAHGY